MPRGCCGANEARIMVAPRTNIASQPRRAAPAVTLRHRGEASDSSKRNDIARIRIAIVASEVTVIAVPAVIARAEAIPAQPRFKELANTRTRMAPVHGRRPMDAIKAARVRKRPLPSVFGRERGGQPGFRATVAASVRSWRKAHTARQTRIAPIAVRSPSLTLCDQVMASWIAMVSQSAARSRPCTRTIAVRAWHRAAPINRAAPVV